MKMDILKQLPLEIQEIIYNDYLEKQREYHIYCKSNLLTQMRYLEYQIVKHQFITYVDNFKERIQFNYDDDEDFDDYIISFKMNILRYNSKFLKKKYGEYENKLYEWGHRGYD